MMNQVEQDAVRAIVKDFMSQELLFTALDISNEAKKAMPHLRHGEVREVVRGMFPEMQTAGWARSDIDVTLADGSQRQALLYYPLSASWDLESRYDDQKRAQTSSKPNAAAQAVVSAVVDAVTNPMVVTSIVAQGVADAAADMAQATATTIANTAHDLWKNMFQSKPSLFPLK